MKKAMNGKAEFILAATDILNGFALEKEIKGEAFELKAYNYYETQVVTLGFRYKF